MTDFDDVDAQCDVYDAIHELFDKRERVALSRLTMNKRLSDDTPGWSSFPQDDYCVYRLRLYMTRVYRIPREIRAPYWLACTMILPCVYMSRRRETMIVVGEDKKTMKFPECLKYVEEHSVHLSTYKYNSPCVIFKDRVTRRPTMWHYSGVLMLSECPEAPSSGMMPVHCITTVTSDTYTDALTRLEPQFDATIRLFTLQQLRMCRERFAEKFRRVIDVLELDANGYLQLR